MLCSEVENLELPDASLIRQWNHMQRIISMCAAVKHVKAGPSDDHQQMRIKSNCVILAGNS
jgi:hypothetical protein